ncbi:uncharacterized protein LOC106666950 [Cimex lectularius]|uniref:Transposase Helix-turn-helix domain-containing protein n=1 Tax=Cimex lectularius TaxID=79782 RepID=A0A8I6RR63_CIMLE|nr:uncharacterized protein LOC106666950 [Cimex lectularius]
MSGKVFETSEEVRRKNNITKFLDGLFKDDQSTSSTLELNTASSFTKVHKKPTEVSNKKCVVAQEQKSSTSSYAKLECLSSNELRALRAHPEILQKNLEKLLILPMSIHNLKQNDTLVRLYTGIPNAEAFFNLAAMFSKGSISYYHGWVVGQLTIKQQLLMTLVKLRLNLSDIHLSHRFTCSMATVTNTLYTWIHALQEKLYDTAVTMFGSLRDPYLFDGLMVLQTVSVYRKAPDNPHLPHKTPPEPYTTVLLSTADGTVIYTGELFRWKGRKDDIVQYCGVLETLMPGDVIAVNGDAIINLPVGVKTRNIDLGLVRLKKSRDDLKRRLMEWDVVKAIPPSLGDCSSNLWKVVVSLTNYIHFNDF